MPILSFFIVLTISICNAQFVAHDDPQMPRNDERMAVGYYNDSIYYLYVSSACTFRSTY